MRAGREAANRHARSRHTEGGHAIAPGLVHPIPNSANLKWENAANQIALNAIENIVQKHVQKHAAGGIMSLLGNIIWMLFGGVFTALYWFCVGCLFCLTIVGIPFGLQSFKMAKLALLPFGARIN